MCWSARTLGATLAAEHDSCQPVHYQRFAAATILPFTCLIHRATNSLAPALLAYIFNAARRPFMEGLPGMWKTGTFKATSCIQSGVECVETR